MISSISSSFSSERNCFITKHFFPSLFLSLNDVEIIIGGRAGVVCPALRTPTACTLPSSCGSGETRSSLFWTSSEISFEFTRSKRGNKCFCLTYIDHYNDIRDNLIWGYWRRIIDILNSAKTYFRWEYLNLDSMSPLRGLGPRFKFAENILCSHRKLYPIFILEDMVVCRNFGHPALTSSFKKYCRLIIFLKQLFISVLKMFQFPNGDLLS